MKLRSLLATLGLLLIGAAAQAAPELYFVEPMVCTGAVNLRPPGWARSYDQAGVNITSFKSMRKDCTLADSSSTSANYFEKGETVTVSSKPEVADWFDRPLLKDGDTVSLPNGAWPGEMELKIINSGIVAVDGKRTDILKGRQLIMKKDGQEYYYDFTCTATVVETPSTIVNNTAKCANP